MTFEYFLKMGNIKIFKMFMYAMIFKNLSKRYLQKAYVTCAWMNIYDESDRGNHSQGTQNPGKKKMRRNTLCCECEQNWRTKKT